MSSEMLIIFSRNDKQLFRGQSKSKTHLIVSGFAANSQRNRRKQHYCCAETERHIKKSSLESLRKWSFIRMNIHVFVKYLFHLISVIFYFCNKFQNTFTKVSAIPNILNPTVTHHRLWIPRATNSLNNQHCQLTNHYRASRPFHCAN